MRRVLSVLTSLVGVVLLVVGVVVVVVVGPDDEAVSPSRAVGDETPVVWTSSGVLAVSGARVAVEATPASGEVFVGVARRVDAADYLAGVRSEQVYAVRPPFALESRSQGETPVPAPPGQVDFWRDASQGPGTQRVEVDLDGDRYQVVVARPEGEEPLAADLRMAVRIEGVFVTALMVAAVGLALVVVGVILWRGRRRPDGRTEAAGPAARDSRADREAGATEGPTRGGDRTFRLAVPLVAGAVLAGCVQVPQPLDGDGESAPSVTAEQGQRAVTAYDETNNAANAALDRELTATAESGALLEQSDASLRVLDVLDQPPPAPFTHDDVEVWPAPTEQYPAWFVAVSRESDAPEDRRTLHVFSRERSFERWRAETSIGLAAADVPEPQIVDGAAGLPSAAQQAQATAAVAALAEHLATGATPDGLDVAGSESVVGYRTTTTPTVADLSLASSTCAQDAELPARFVRVEGATLALAPVRCTLLFEAPAGAQLDVSGETAALAGQDGVGSELELTSVHSVALLVADDGRSRVLGDDWRMTKAS